MGLGLRMNRMEAPTTTIRAMLPELSARPLQEQVTLLAKLAWQVAALHRESRLHGSITPEAIQLKDGAPLLDAPSPEVKKVLGYAAPELLRGERQAYTAKTDIFALGVLCYELLTAHKPFDGASDMQVLLATLEGKPRPLSLWRPECPAALNELCLKMIAANKENRPASSEDIARSLDEILWQLQAPQASQEISPEKPRSAISIIQEISRESSADETSAPALPETLATPSSASAQSAQKTPQSGSGSGSNKAHIFPPQSSPSDTLAHGNVGFQPSLPQQAMSPSQRYKVLGELARGGLGKILRATDQHMGRPVAIKEMLQRLPGEFETRFLREAKITARLEHPAIIPVHDLGRWSDGSMYYTMKMVNGRSFDKIIAENKTLEERIALLPHVIAAADAIAYSHSQHIIHRDLKPHNVLIGPFGETVVIDWGIAKDLRDPSDTDSKEEPYRESPEHGDLTKEGAIVGTPAYMPLEQAQGKKVDARADVYALGAILYHLLSGKSPYSGKRSVAILRDLLEGPPKPLQERVPDVPRELLTIVEKAMARNLDDRYPSAQELADDLKKFQTGQLVGSYQYSTWELITRTVKRYQLPIGVGALAAVVLLMAATWYTMQLAEKERRALKSANEANIAKEDAELKNKILEENNRRDKDRQEALYLELAESKLDVDPAESLSWLKKLDPNHEKTPWNVVRLIAADAIERGIPTVYGADWSTPNFVNTSQINHTALSPDGRLLAVGHEDGSLFLWDLEKQSRVVLGSGKEKHQLKIRRVAFSPDGTMLATASEDKSVRLWDIASGESRRLPHENPPEEVVFSPDQRMIASADGSTVRVWNLLGEELYSFPNPNIFKVSSLSFSPDSQTLAAAYIDGDVSLWSLPSGAKRSLAHFPTAAMFVGLSFSPNGEWLVVYGEDLPDAHIWRCKDWKEFTRPAPIGANRASISPDGKTIAIADEQSHKIFLWSIDARGTWGAAPSQILEGHQTAVQALQFSADSSLLASAGTDKVIKLWGLDGSLRKTYTGLHSATQQLFFTLGQADLISVGDEAIFYKWQISQTPQPQGRHESIFDLAISLDGETIVSAGLDKDIILWDRKTNQTKKLEGHNAFVKDIGLSPDKSLLVSASFDGTARLWDTATAKSELLLAQENSMLSAAFAPNGTLMAYAGSGNAEGTLVFLRDNKTRQIKALKGHQGDVWGLAFSPDSKMLASVSSDGTARIWDTSSGEELQKLITQKEGTSISFSPTGRQIALTTNHSPQIQLWDLDAQQPTLLLGHTSEAYQTAFSPDGLSLLSASTDKTVRLWDLKSGKARAIYPSGVSVYSVAFMPDNKSFISAGRDGALYQWADELPRSVAELSDIIARYPTPRVKLSGRL